MKPGFDPSNLANAAALLVRLANERGGSLTKNHDGKLVRFDLSRDDGARDYLMASAEDVYARSSNGVVAQIRDVVYYSIGVVFELAPDEMIPPVLTRGTEPPAHIAYFWQVL